MEKIGVITINDYNNYGNRLQCYAVQHYLENSGYLVENIYNEYNRDCFLIKNGKNIIRWIRNFPNRKIIALRRKNFENFNHYIKFSEESIKNGKFSGKLNEKYEFFVTGSDQVWNPCDSGRSEIDFLSFAEDKKKISFSASIGVEKLPDHTIEKYRAYLKGYKKISVREEKAGEIVRDLTGRTDIEVLVDPTMLLSAEEWEQISEKPNMEYSSKYILTYFLGASEKKKNIVKSIAQKYSCEIIDIYDKNSRFYACGPQQFLYLEKNAFLICTDSFHSIVFSFLFNRPFIVFDRENAKMNMNSRIESFLDMFDLQKNMYNQKKNIEEYLSWDYTNGYIKLEEEREKVRQFMAGALS